MTALGIIARLAEKNIIVEVYGDQLKVLADRNAVTQDISDLIRENKLEIMAYLSRSSEHKDTRSTGKHEYVSEAGYALEISHDEFEDIVEVFRMFLTWKNRREGAIV